MDARTAAAAPARALLLLARLAKVASCTAFAGPSLAEDPMPSQRSRPTLRSRHDERVPAKIQQAMRYFVGAIDRVDSETPRDLGDRHGARRFVRP